MSNSDLRLRLRHIIFDHDDRPAKTFDVLLLALISFSVLLVMLESVDTYRDRYDTQLLILEWIVTGLFTLEYVARLWTSDRPVRYARSFFGVIDLLAILPVYISVLIPGAQSLLVIRSLRLLRVFRVFKMARWLSEANYLVRALRSSSRKIVVFLVTVVLLNIIVGSSMYLIEGGLPGSDFDSMFRGVYWSIVTMSTVGFGDIAPQTGVGQVLAAVLMITGYSVIAVPTGIVSAEVAGARQRELSCPGCGSAVHGASANFCDACGSSLPGAGAVASAPITG
ncbi:MAG: ion transporter [Acidimicrobiia bacterium]|nr:ion transporter [Acidimicrobiia bacterium]